MKHIRNAVLFVLLFSALFLSAVPVMAGTVRVSLSEPAVTVASGLDGVVRFGGGNFQMPGRVGEPQLPYRVLKVLLPPEANLSTLSVSLENLRESEMSGSWTVAPVPPMATWDGEKTVVAWPEGRKLADGRDVEIYGRDCLFPEKRLLPHRAGEIRGWKVVDVPVALFRYNPVALRLVRLEEADVVVNFSDLAGKFAVNGIADSIAPEMVRDAVVNFDEMAPSYTGEADPIGRSAPEAMPGYVIVTTQNIVSASASLDAFVTQKEAKGFDVDVVTDDEWGGGSGDEAAENVRLWLAGNYQSRNIRYVLLVGNPNPVSGDVPMKMLWPRNNATFYEEYRESPSDLYYADLTGNWDLDGDGYYGEWDDDFGDGGIDTNWDVVVGRIPVYGSVADLDSVLAKTIRYETADPAAVEWRKNVLLPMVPSDSSTPGYPLGEAIKDDVVRFLEDRTCTRVYSGDYGLDPAPEFTLCSEDIVTDAWAGTPFGIVAWWTHGSGTRAWKIIDVAHVPSLDDEHPSIVFQCSCLNAYPERSDNLSYSLLKNGAVATIGATRVSWYWRGQTDYAESSTNSGMTYGFSKNLLFYGMDAGSALASVKQKSYVMIDSDWMNFSDFNVYGDPSLKLDVPGSAPGAITVDVEGPAEARWSLNRSEVHESGATVDVVGGAVCDISFTDVDGWIKPQSSTVPVSAGGNIDLDFSYTKRTLNGPTFVKPGGDGDGSSWDSPRDLAEALRDAMSGEEIWIAEGVYRPKYDDGNNLPLTGEERDVTFALRSDIKLYGGFPADLTGAVSSDRRPKSHQTILTGDLDGNDATGDYDFLWRYENIVGSNACHVVSCIGADNVVIDGVILTGGNAGGGAANHGGGLYVQDSTVRLVNCMFSGNAGDLGGGGMIAVFSNADMEKCVFNGNGTQGSGGGVFNYWSEVSFSRCSFKGNGADEFGGGLGSNGGRTSLDDCFFELNSANCGGGSASWGGSLSVMNSTFLENLSNQGGGLYSKVAEASLTNSTFCENSASDAGTALSCCGGSMDIVNCTFAANSALSEGGSAVDCQDGSIAVKNSIFWNSTEAEFSGVYGGEEASASADHCIVQGGVPDGWSADSVITKDPLLFSLKNNGGFTLTRALLPGSPALDSGTSEGAPAFDQRGVARPQGAGVDMGAYEVRPGTIRVLIVGPETASWSVDGDGGHSRGESVEGLQIGTHTVSFSPVEGWRSPLSRDVILFEGETLVVAGDYGLTASRPASWSHVEAGDEVFLKWDPVGVLDGPVKYEVYMEQNGTFVPVPAECVDGNSVKLDLNGHTTYTLRVDADGFEGLPWTFTTPNRAPKLLRRSPVNGTWGLPVDTALSWLYEDPDGDSVDYYTYLNDGSTDMEDLPLVCSGDVTALSPELSGDKGYRWQVVARDRFDGMEKFEPGITSSDIWSFAVKSGVHRIPTPAVSEDVLANSGVNDVWVATVVSADREKMEVLLGESLVPAESVLSMDVRSLSKDVSQAERRSFLEGAGTPIADVLAEGFHLSLSVPKGSNAVAVPVSLSFTEEQTGRRISEWNLLDDVHIFAVVGGRAFDLVSLAGERRSSLFHIASDGLDGQCFVSFRIYLVGGEPGVSVLDGADGAAFLLRGTFSPFSAEKTVFSAGSENGKIRSDAIPEGGVFRTSFMEATVTSDKPSGSGGSGCEVAFVPAGVFLLAPLVLLLRRR